MAAWQDRRQRAAAPGSGISAQLTIRRKIADNDSDKTPKQAFVAQEDRPEVGIKSDTPLSELRVRDLFSILGQVGGSGKDFWDGKSWQKDDFDGPIKWRDGKDLKDANDAKLGKDAVDSKHFKDGKDHKDAGDKRSHKELKIEKVETDGVFDPRLHGPDPDPRFDQVIQAVSGLSAKVAQLADQVEELKKAGKG